MAIYAVTGKPRHGKTYYIAAQIPRWLKDAEQSGYKIFSNIKLYPEYLGYDTDKIVGDLYCQADRENPEKLIYYWKNIDEWNLMTHGRIIADEGQRYFNARSWSMLSTDTEIKLQQHGKEDLDIWLTTQHYTRLDVTLRVLVEKFLIVKKIFGGTGNPRPIFGLGGIIHVTEHYLEDLDRYERQTDASEMSIKPEYSEYRLIRVKLARLYNTLEMVGLSRPMPLRHNERLCPTCGVKHTTHN
jgi:hypothetical protein